MGDQVRPALVVFQMAPPTAPKEKMLGSPGTPVAAMARPPRNGPIIRQRRPSKRLPGGWAARVAAKTKRARRRQRIDKDTSTDGPVTFSTGVSNENCRVCQPDSGGAV